MPYFMHARHNVTNLYLFGRVLCVRVVDATSSEGFIVKKFVEIKDSEAEPQTVQTFHLDAARSIVVGQVQRSRSYAETTCRPDS